MKTIRWGIIGCGEVTEVKSGPALQQAAGSALVAVMRRNGVLAKDYAARHQVPKWYDDADALIRDPEVDAVYIATPPGSHHEYTLRAAAAGKPVYVEKPMARFHSECLEMIDACRAAGVPLFTAYYRRSLPRFQKVKELLDAGAIGKPRWVMTYLNKKSDVDYANLPWRLRYEISGGGWFVDMTCHVLDLLDYYLGPITTVRGNAVNQAGDYAVEDMVSAQFEFGSGVHGIGAWCFNSYRNDDYAEIVGEAGKITFSAWGPEPVRLVRPEGTEEFPLDYPLHIQQPLIQTVVDELNGIGTCPSHGESAARTTWVMDEILKRFRADLKR